MPPVRGAAAILIALVFAVPMPAIANAVTGRDVVVEWNEHRKRSLADHRSQGTRRPWRILHLAMVHGTAVL